jgi:16S rRNA processing protein RimM
MLGYVQRISGVKGEVVIEMDVDDPTRYKKVDAVFGDVSGSLVPFFVKGTKLNGNSLTVALEGIATPADAKMLVGCTIYLPLTALAPLDDKRFYNHEIVGYEVIDERFGVVGIAVEVLERMMQPVLKIRSGKNEVMIPITNDAVKKVDRAERKLYVTSPEGLIELYLSPTDEEPDDL